MELVSISGVLKAFVVCYCLESGSKSCPWENLRLRYTVVCSLAGKEDPALEATKVSAVCRISETGHEAMIFEPELD